MLKLGWYLLQVFHFLYTYSVAIDICPFTLDEFAQAFYDKVNSQIISFAYHVFWFNFSLPVYFSWHLDFKFFELMFAFSFRILCYLENFMWPFWSFFYLMWKRRLIVDFFPSWAYLVSFLHLFIRWVGNSASVSH